MWCVPVCVAVWVRRCLCQCVEAGRACEVPSFPFCLISGHKCFHWTCSFTGFLLGWWPLSPNHLLVPPTPSCQCWTYNLHSHACVFMCVRGSRLRFPCSFSSYLLSHLLSSPWLGNGSKFLYLWNGSKFASWKEECCLPSLGVLLFGNQMLYMPTRFFPPRAADPFCLSLPDPRITHDAVCRYTQSPTCLLLFFGNGASHSPG